MTRRNTGKYLEDAVEEHLKILTLPGFKYRRLYDSYAARNYIPANPADFFIAVKGVALHLECKSQKGVTCRLNKFSQHSDMIDWDKAGVPGFVLVHFYELPFETFFLVNVWDLELGRPSWVIKDHRWFPSVGEAISFLLEDVI